MAKPSEEDKRLLSTVVDHFYKEDTPTRERQIRNWRRLKLYWANFSQIYWSEVAQDWKIANRDVSNEDTDQEYYDRPVNVFRAFIETIIAALSIQIPAISCSPDDADNPLDLSTAKAGDKIAEQVYKHNNVVFLWLHALYVFMTEGMVACYNYSHKDEAYGTYNEPKYKDEEVEAHVCPNCEQRLADDIFSNKVIDEFNPGDAESELQDTIKNEGPVCPVCGEILDPDLQKTKLIVNRLVGTTTKAKSRICLEVYGGLYVKVANYARCQDDTPYLLLMYETHYANALEEYPHLREDIPSGGWSNVGINDPYEQFGRLNVEYRGDYPLENVTIKHAWLRPASFNILPDADYDALKRKYPNGVRVDLVNETVAGCEAEKLDDHWTLTKNPLADYLNHDPLGELLTNIQDITNDLISLILQTIEHGIEQTWADPAVVDFNAQGQIEAQPGTITPTKTVTGKRVSEAFYSTKTAALAPEVIPFFRLVQELGQFVSGALPSLFGGQSGKGGSKTAAEYAMSRSMALQRLQTPWKMLTLWWKDIFSKVIPMYIQNLEEDERIVEKDDKGNFLNVYIRKAELAGKIGSIELESSEQIPISDEQQKEMMLNLLQLNIEELNAAFTSPENLPFIRKLVRIPQFKLPGEDDRQKQYEEINLLVASAPIVMAPEINPTLVQEEVEPTELPSVPIDPLVDNHEIESATCRTWLIGPAGRLAKIENPDGYKNVMLHMKEHINMMQQNMQMMAQQQPANEPGTKPEVEKV